MVSACIDRLEGGVQFCLLLYLLFCLANNNIIDIVQVSFIHIFIPRFLADGFGNVILLKVGHIFICLENAWHPCQGLLLAYLGQGRSMVSRSWWLSDSYRCKLPQNIAPDTSSYWQTFPSLLVQDRSCSLIGQYTIPWSCSRLRVPDLGFCSASSYLCTSWSWIPVPCFCQSIYLTRFLQSKVLVKFRLPPSVLYYSVVVFTVFVPYYSYSVCEIVNT